MNNKRSILSDLGLAVRLAWNLGWIVAIPAAGLGFAGAYLDRAQGTSPLFLIGGLILAMAISGLGVWRILRNFLK